MIEIWGPKAAVACRQVVQAQGKSLWHFLASTLHFGLSTSFELRELMMHTYAFPTFIIPTHPPLFNMSPTSIRPPTSPP